MSADKLYPQKSRGVAFFTLALVVYCLQTPGVKVAMQEYAITTQELMYYVSLVSAILFFIQSKCLTENGSDDKLAAVDLFNVPSGLIGAVLGRAVMGFFSDVLTFLAYNYTSYSKS